MKKQTLSEEFRRMQKLAGINEINISVFHNELFADFGSKENNIGLMFARTMSETLHLLDFTTTKVEKLTIDSLFSGEGMNDVQDGNDFYAGPEESLRFFQQLNNTFIISHNIDGDKESFKITKTGLDSFTAEKIENKKNKYL